MKKARKWDTQETAFAEIEVRFHRHGYYLPAKVDCDPNDGHDEEGEDNRDITEILINGKKFDLKKLAQDMIDMVVMEYENHAIEDDSFVDDAELRIITYLQGKFFQPAVDAWEE